MKELSIEEKARAYDEALKKVKDLISRCKNDRDRRTMIYRVEDIESILPELAESEDERIRKEIIEFLKKSSGGFLDTTTHCKTFGKWLAWLEKQSNKVVPATKEQRDLLFQKMKEAEYEWDAEHKQLKKIEHKSAEWSEEDKKRISSILLSIEDCEEQYPNLREYQYDIDWLKSLKERVQSQQKWNEEDEQQGEQKSIESTKTKLNESMIKPDPNPYWTLAPEYKLMNEQNPAWSEEDEKMLSDIIKDLVHPWNEYIPDRIEEEIKWLKNKLKSLRSQNRQEWNSKDKKIKNEIVNYFTCQCKDEPTRIKTLNRWICWLNALENSSVIKPMPEFDEWLKQIWDILDWAEEKGRITYSTWEDYTGWLSLLNPKNRWKPSDEQLNNILDVLSFDNCTPKRRELLESLYNDLKKL